MILVIFSMFAFQVLADAPTTVGMPVPAVVPAVVPPPAPVVLPQALPPPQIQAAAVQAPVLVAVPVASAPPAWVQSFLVVVESLPVIGPIASKAILYAGIFAVALTSLVAFLLGLLSSLSAAFGAIPALAKFSAVLEEFKDSKFMYWLKFFSNFNAQKPQA